MSDKEIVLQNDVYLILGRLEGKLDSVMTITEKQWNSIEKHDKRIKVLEQDKSLMYGAAAVLGILGSLVIWVISHFIRGT